MREQYTMPMPENPHPAGMDDLAARLAALEARLAPSAAPPARPQRRLPPLGLGGLARSRLLVAALAGSLLLLGLGSNAFASIPDPNGTIHACYRPAGSHTDDERVLRILDAANGPCDHGQVQITWSQTGPAGPQGPQGVTGPQGPAGPAADLSPLQTQVAGLQTQVAALQTQVAPTSSLTPSITPSSTPGPQFCVGSSTCGYSSGPNGTYTYFCLGEHYDVNANLADGCEVTAAPQGNHSQATSLSLGYVGCTSSIEVSGVLPSDARAHQDPSSVNTMTGAAADWFTAALTGNSACPNYSLTLKTTGGGGNDSGCYQMTVTTDQGATQTSSAIGGNAATTISGSSGSNVSLTIEVQKTCPLPVQEAVNYTLHVQH